MKAFAMLIALFAFFQMAYAEQGDEQDRALTEQMMHEEQAKDALQKSGYGDAGKVAAQAGQPESKEQKQPQQPAVDSQ